MNNGLEPTPQPLQTLADEQSLQTEGPDSSFGQTVVSRQPVSQTIIDKPKRSFPWLRVIGIAVLIMGLGAGTLLFLNINKKKPTESNLSASARIKSQSIALPALSQELANANQAANTLTVNGQVVVNNSLVLQPSAQPKNPLTGQMYYDQGNNNLAFYNGTQFVNLLGTTINTQVINNFGGSSITNILSGGGGGVAAVNGIPGSIAMFTTANQLGSSSITQSGATINVNSNANAANAVNIDAGSAAAGIQIGNSASNHDIQIGSGAGVQTTTLGSHFGSSATTIQAGSAGLNVSTGAGAGVTGSLSITTGNSSTTASGNITIDAGVGVVDGELIEHKGFETGLDNMNAWFGNSVAQTSAVAHTGNFSLAETGNAVNWGIIETLPGVSVVAGHQYYFSLWVRASTTPRNITASVVWNGAITNVPLTPVVDSTSGWTEMTGLGVAPGGAISAYFRAQSTGTVGEVHYFDDMTVTDLSSAAAISSISIGSANAKKVTIGNINQIGATTINGGSGIDLNSGAAGITLNGGVLSMTGSAASSINTTAGALTLTSAGSATWGIGTATSGVGGDLTLRGGRGGTEAVNNGGNLIIQGGAPNGAGTPGSVIIRPQLDATDAFQIQNATNTPFLVADSSNMVITVMGTDTTFATLALGNAHVRATQTTPPTIGTPASCGTTPAAAITAGSTDSAGSFTITTGTGGTSATCDTVITFHRPYGTAPKTILVVGKADAASAARQIYVSAANATTFTTSFGASAAGANSTAYSFSYWVVE